MTVALTSYRCTTVSNNAGSKRLKHRRLPARARSTLRKKDLVADVTLTESPNKVEHASLRLCKLRHSYARRGVSPPLAPPLLLPRVVEEEEVIEVTKVGLDGAKRRFVKLEAPADCDSESEDDSDNMSNNGMSGLPFRVRYVQFASHCAVVEIPHFRDYSLQQKSAMWNGCKKIRTMARKNTAEYQYDGWSVETAAEEDQFITVSGNAVHPAHVSQAERKKAQLEAE